MSLRNQTPTLYWSFCTIIEPLLSLSAFYMIYFNTSNLMDPGFARSWPSAKSCPRTFS